MFNIIYHEIKKIKEHECWGGWKVEVTFLKLLLE